MEKCYVYEVTHSIIVKLSIPNECNDSNMARGIKEALGKNNGSSPLKVCTLSVYIKKIFKILNIFRGKNNMDIKLYKK